MAADQVRTACVFVPVLAPPHLPAGSLSPWCPSLWGVGGMELPVGAAWRGAPAARAFSCQRCCT